MITLFEKFNNPDLRKMSTYVLCIKTYKSVFKKDSYYKVDGMYGDPQGAIEKYNIRDYVPLECISRVLIVDDNNKKVNFKVSENYNRMADQPSFYEYFDIAEFSDTASKYNV